MSARDDLTIGGATAAGAATAGHRSAVIAVLTDDEPGTLVRIAGLFSGRGYNIDNLSVAPVGNGLARFTILTTGTTMVIEQIKAQLARLIPVHRVVELTGEPDGVWARELALLKIRGTPEALAEALRLVHEAGGRPLAIERDRCVVELSAGSEDVDRLVDRIRVLCRCEVARTGITALAVADAAGLEIEDGAG